MPALRNEPGLPEYGDLSEGFSIVEPEYVAKARLEAEREEERMWAARSGPVRTITTDELPDNSRLKDTQPVNIQRPCACTDCESHGGQPCGRLYVQTKTRSGKSTKNFRCGNCMTAYYARRAKETGGLYGYTWSQIRKAALAATPYCAVPGCKSPGPYDVDHIIPGSLEGGVQVLCRQHHAQKTAEDNRRKKGRAS